MAEDITARKDELGFSAFTSAGMDGSSDWRYKTHLANLPIYFEYQEDALPVWYRGFSACAKIRWIQTQVCTYVHGLRFLFCKGTANGGKNERRSKAHPAGPAPRTHP